MATATIADAKSFLYRHPWATPTDDPVQLIAGLVDEIERLKGSVAGYKSADQLIDNLRDRIEDLETERNRLVAQLRVKHKRVK